MASSPSFFGKETVVGCKGHALAARLFKENFVDRFSTMPVKRLLVLKAGRRLRQTRRSSAAPAETSTAGDSTAAFSMHALLA